jgi:hypothetical protein
MVTPTRIGRWTALLLPLLGWTSSVGQDVALGQEGSSGVSKIDFNKQIRPILSENCFTCHGPDERERKARLRLDTREGATARLRSGGHAIVPGKSAESDLVERVLSDEPSERMPPPRTKKRLTSQQIQLLRRWIDQGAPWSRHWSFVTAQRPALPVVRAKGWARNEIDRFILARLEAEGIEPSTEAERVTLIRRVTLDLTGLPPTPAEVDALLADTSPNAYEKVVDRLLASPHYGERMAVDWLDAARFADTHGYHIDSGRDMTRWREWVIDAFNTNLPFDRFTVEQLAGDLLPGATLRQKIASGFNRNHMINFEGGAIPEEYQNAYLVDRVNTTATVWLGLTVACAQCHDHKYDPISQKAYYQLYAFFNNIPENGLDGAKGNAAPFIKAPSRQQQMALDKNAVALGKLKERLSAPSLAADEGQVLWEESASRQVKWQVLDPTELQSMGGATLTKLPDKSIRADGTNPPQETYTVASTVDLASVTGVRLEALPDDGLAGRGPGRSVNGNVVLTEVAVHVGGEPVKLRAASADFSQKDYPVAHAIDGKATTGWAILPQVGKAHNAVFSFDGAVPAGKQTLRVTLDFQSPFAQHQFGRFRLSVTDAADPHQKSNLPANIADIMAVPSDKRAEAQKATLREYYRAEVAPEFREIREQISSLRKKKAELEKGIPTAMVMQEMTKPRDTFLLLRGQYDKRGEKVTADVPASLMPLPKDASPNRLGLARWLVDPEQPLTARVTVNRYWQMFFGTGLVKTAEDFGSQGEPPSHPELLDWLAVEFRQKWDVKALVRKIVTSATYRQSSAAPAAMHARDPENRLLARGPRLRLQAEFIRDQALAVSGLLNREIGGASVFPYQPKGLWQELAARSDSKNWSAQFFVQSKGKDLYRRTMYTFWKRTSPPPQLTTFDAPDREVCTVRRPRTNTPLQALVLLNDPTYVEASRKLAARMMTEGGETSRSRIDFAFRLVTGRHPKDTELAVLVRVFDAQREAFAKDNEAALKLLRVGESRRDERLSVPELAAWTMVASVLLNLDETVTKG